MKSFTYLLLALASSALSAASALGSRTSSPKGCNADNCLRALRAPARINCAKTDCSTWMTKVVTKTPPPVIVTKYSTTTSTLTALNPVTATVTDPIPTTVEYIATEVVTALTASITVGAPATLRKRKVTPTIPTYATACSGEVRFASACSCIGVTSGSRTVTLSPMTTTTTLPSVVVVTKTVPTTAATFTERATTTTTPTTTITTEIAGTATAFYLHGNSERSRGFVVDTQDPESRVVVGNNVPPSRLVLEPNGFLTWEGRTAVVLNRTVDVAFPLSGDVDAADFPLGECTINTDKSLSCNTIGMPGSSWRIASLTDGRRVLSHATYDEWTARWRKPPLTNEWTIVELTPGIYTDET